MPARTTSRLLGPILALTFLLSAAPQAASTHNDRVALGVHDNIEDTLETRHVPHVACGFYIESSLLGDDSGWIRFVGLPPTGDEVEVNATGATQTWTASSGSAGGGRQLLKGPYYLPADHYRVEVYTDDGHPGEDAGRLAKTTTFWVEPCDEALVNPQCPSITSAEASGDDRGNQVALRWTPPDGAEAHVIYRAREGSEFEAIANVGGGTTSHVDATTIEGVAYEYYVTAVVGNVESEACAMVSVSAVPFFSSAFAAALTLLGCVGAYAMLRRR